eukprot:7049222-Prymnesium_polylepis.1
MMTRTQPAGRLKCCAESNKSNPRTVVVRAALPACASSSARHCSERWAGAKTTVQECPREPPRSLWRRSSSATHR